MARRGLFRPSDFLGEVNLDFRRLTFAGPCAMTCVKALLAKGQENLPPESCFLVEHESQDAIQYLDRMDFFGDDIRWCRQPLEGHSYTRHSSSGRFLPIQNLRHLTQTDHVSRQMANCLVSDDPSSANKLQYTLSELIDNALQHSYSRTGAFVTAQKYELKGRVDLLIVDTGVGIKKHLNDHPKYRNIVDDKEAIRLALTPFVTGTYISNPREDHNDYQNQGLGLSVIDQIAHKSGNAAAFFIWSGTGLYRSAMKRIEDMPVAWPGTIVFLTLPVKLPISISEIVKNFDLSVKKTGITLKFNP